MHIFILSIIFVPLSLLLGIIGIIKKQILWSVVGIIFAIIGFFTSPTLIAMFTIGSGVAAGVPTSP